MGVKLVCVRDFAPDGYSFKLESSREQSSSFQDSIDFTDIIKIQSVLRGYLDRHKTMNICIRQRTVKPRTHKKSITPDIGTSSDFTPLETVPSYISSIVQETINNLGPYRFKYQLEKKQRKSKGPIKLENNAVYIGEWDLQNKRDGYGMQTWQDSTLFEGYWKEDKFFIGRMIYENGDAYEGDWQDEQAHGYGAYYYKDGTVYKGEWAYDKKHGKGTETSSEGVIFSGNFVQDRKEGRCLIYFKDGSKYEGNFSNDTLNGVGRYVWADGKEYDGEWVSGKMHGKGVFIWPDGKRYEGEYSNDKKHGTGKLMYTNGVVHEGTWENGKKNGLGVERFPNGVLKKGEWSHDKRIRWLD